MPLSATFIEYLRDRSRDRTVRLADELERAGYTLEAAGYRRFADAGPHWFTLDGTAGLWAQSRCWIGPYPPEPQAAGDIWMDVVEAAPMILTPGDQPDPEESYTPEALASFLPFHAWMALRPTSNWQFAAFLDLACLGHRTMQLVPPLPLFNASRILGGPETGPASGLLADEAILYANWFGKMLCGKYEWQAAERLLQPDRLGALWAPVGREWARRFSEGVNAAVSPANIHLDWTDEYDREEDPPPAQRIFYGEFEAPRDVAFRTAVRFDLGLFSQPADDSLSPLNVQLVSLAQR
jgi:hypothetical protein